ncbi:uncharacterized protein LOC108858078 [Raphanus sativus]|uniref:Uncharacterized protein LOC108858078 n=1 Tax=Raphanus sativus TaxID=3726 RepID=A0A6J0NTV8_RAPSA|nr:uncharacterized protein LOC108858078 [Raphanus sativus]
MWVANYDRLPTRARLASWGVPISPLCPLYSSYPETRDHLFLECNYSLLVWKEVFIRCSQSATVILNWSELLSWIRTSATAKLSFLKKIAAQVVISHIWKQRNNLIHNKISIPAPIVFHAIDRDVKNIISARRHKKAYRDLMAIWLS